MSRAGLWRDNVTAEMRRAGYRRIMQAQAFYFVCILLSFASTSLSIAAFILVQANYAVLPWIRVLYRGVYKLLRREPGVEVE